MTIYKEGMGGLGRGIRGIAVFSIVYVIALLNALSDNRIVINMRHNDTSDRLK